MSTLQPISSRSILDTVHGGASVHVYWYAGTRKPKAGGELVPVAIHGILDLPELITTQQGYSAALKRIAEVHQTTVVELTLTAFEFWHGSGV